MTVHSPPSLPVLQTASGRSKNDAAVLVAVMGKHATLALYDCCLEVAFPQGAGSSTA
jgi:hypothetical protein